MKTYCIILIVIGLAFPLAHATTTHMLQSDRVLEEDFDFPGSTDSDDGEYLPEEINNSPIDAGNDLLLVKLDPGVWHPEKSRIHHRDTEIAEKR